MPGMTSSSQTKLFDLAQLPPVDALDGELLRRMRHLTAKLIVEPGHRVLVLGREGGYSRYLRDAAEADVSVAADISENSGPFDRLVWVGAFESDTQYRRFFSSAFEKLERNSVVLLQGIGQHRHSPGGAPAVSEILPHIEKARFLIKDLEILQDDQSALFAGCAGKTDDVGLEEFLTSQAGAFSSGERFIYQLQISPFQDSVPFTRDYIERRTEALRVRERELGYGIQD